MAGGAFPFAARVSGDLGSAAACDSDVAARGLRPGLEVHGSAREAG